MRGSTPLNVAAASVMDNNELALALWSQIWCVGIPHCCACGELQLFIVVSQDISYKVIMYVIITIIYYVL